jgi:hypothetical protein
LGGERNGVFSDWSTWLAISTLPVSSSSTGQTHRLTDA